MRSVVAIAVLAIMLAGCQLPGTGAENNPQTGTSTVGAQAFQGRTLAGATYVIKSEGTVYNIDTDGSPSSEVAAQAIAAAILSYDKSIDQLMAEAAKPDADADSKNLAYSLVKDLQTEKRLFMSEAKGAFGVSITIQQGQQTGNSTVDTAGATGESSVPPTKDVPPPPEAEEGGGGT